MFFLGKITKCKDEGKGPKVFSAKGRIDEEIDLRDLYQQKGFSSVPKEGDSVIVLERGGLKIAIATESDDRPSLEPGESAAYSSKDNYIKFKTDGSIEIVSKGKLVTLEGDLEVSGEVTAKAKSKPVKLSTHIHGTGVGPSAPPTVGT